MLSKFAKCSGVFFFSKIRLKCFILVAILLYLINEFGLLTHFFEKNYSRFSYPLDINLEEVLLGIKTGKKRVVEPINLYNYSYKIKNEKKCQQVNDNNYDKVVILFAIKSALPNTKRREGIRKTWGWEDRFSDVVTRRVFLLGSTDDLEIQANVNEEHARNKDLVQADFIDTYYNNTIKTMVGFKWVIQNCPRAQFIMFADDDMYISTKNLLKFLRNPFSEDLEYRKLLNVNYLETNYRRLQSSHVSPISEFDGRLLAGYVFFSSPMRHKMSKWYITLDEYPFSKYPPYVTAGAYVMSYPALEDMYYVSMYTKNFKFDDVYLGIIAKKCSIEPLHNDNFYFWRKPYDLQSYSHVIASHGFGDPVELKKVWEEQRSLGHA